MAYKRQVELRGLTDWYRTTLSFCVDKTRFCLARLKYFFAKLIKESYRKLSCGTCVDIIDVVPSVGRKSSHHKNQPPQEIYTLCIVAELVCFLLSSLPLKYIYMTNRHHSVINEVRDKKISWWDASHRRREKTRLKQVNTKMSVIYLFVVQFSC